MNKRDTTNRNIMFIFFHGVHSVTVYRLRPVNLGRLRLVTFCRLRHGNFFRQCPVTLGCLCPGSFFRLRPCNLLCRGTSAPPQKCPGYDTKQSDCEVPVMLELWGIQNTPSSRSILGPLCPGVVALDRVLSMRQIKLNCVLRLN